jgi:hypothetical protein
MSLTRDKRADIDWKFPKCVCVAAKSTTSL